MNLISIKSELEVLYWKYNRAEFVHPDPIEFLHGYGEVRDREIVALVASSLAYGRVAQILSSVSFALAVMKPSPYAFVMETHPHAIRVKLSGFKHRWTTGDDLAVMLAGVSAVLKQYGSLEACFNAGHDGSGETVLPALISFAEELRSAAGTAASSLIPSPSRGSACKRLNLFLRWMVRRDEVDPGGWKDVAPARLIVPLDTHMHRICRALGMTDRKGADMRAALEVTDAFRGIVPEDPVRYDFALTRLGIRADADIGELLHGSLGDPGRIRKE